MLLQLKIIQSFLTYRPIFLLKSLLCLDFSWTFYIIQIGMIYGALTEWSIVQVCKTSVRGFESHGHLIKKLC